MGLFWEGYECPLCGVAMTGDDRRFGTTHFIEDHDHDLWQFSDASMHWDCYAQWEHRQRFARMYFDFWRNLGGKNRVWVIVYLDDEVLVTTNPDRYIRQVDVMLAETGSSHRLDLADWEDWLAGEWAALCEHPVEREAMAPVMPLLRSRFPTSAALIAAAGKRPTLQEWLAACSPLVARVTHELSSRNLAQRARAKGVGCPHCGKVSRKHRFVQVDGVTESGPQSHMTCRHCRKGFGPLDV
jgi:hypothetical protein